MTASAFFIGPQEAIDPSDGVTLLRSAAARAFASGMLAHDFIQAAREAFADARRSAHSKAHGPVPASERLRRLKIAMARKDRRERDKRLGSLPAINGHKRCGLCGEPGHNRARCQRLQKRAGA